MLRTLLISLLIGSGSHAVAAPNFRFEERFVQLNEELKENPLDWNLLSQASDLALLLQGQLDARHVLWAPYQSASFVLNPGLVRKIENKIREQVNQFVSEEVHTLFLRAQVQKNSGDYTSALSLLNQASKAEPGNLLVLREKNYLEYQLGLYSAYQQTSIAIHALVPFDREWRLPAIEAQIKAKNYAKVISELESTPYGRTAREELALAISYVESNRGDQAISLLRGINLKPRETYLSYTQQYYLGMAYQKLNHPNLAKLHFLRAERIGKNLTLPNWDPFDVSLKRNSATHP